MKHQIAAALLAALTTPMLTSCFKEEPLNAECDIEQAYISAGSKLDAWFLYPSDTIVSVQSDENNIEFTMSGAANVSQLAPQFRLTPGATISPESGSLQDFSKGAVTYTVTSEDGKWTRTYTVSIKQTTPFGKEHEFDFENFSEQNEGTDVTYFNWTEPWTFADGNEKQLAIWATGNSGYKISNSSTTKYLYPTSPADEGIDGTHCAKLTTCATSGLAEMVKKPIAAGNLFIGQFDATDALRDAMKATKFGKPFSFESQPLNFEGWYKYQPGATVTDKNKNPLEGEKDYATIYAVLYDNHDEKGNAVVLYGDNVQTSPQVVALARLDDIDTTPEWTHFLLPFQYRQSIDMQKLKNGGYSLAIVCSSSTRGADFIGAKGSTLWVDKLKVTCE